jgi:hypothetical protein
VLIVPFESGYPGYGRVHLLSEADHIAVCKPKSQEDLAYREVLAFVRQSLGVDGLGGGGPFCGVVEEDGEELPACG